MSVDKLRKLMVDFLNEVITVEEFERSYLDNYKISGNLGAQLFPIFNGVFEAVDCYWHECLPGQETTIEISEEQLRKEVGEALTKLNEVLKIPNELDGAKVIKYTSNSAGNLFGITTIKGENNQIIEEIPTTAMAICKYEKSGDYYLFLCDPHWEVINDFDCISVEDGMEIAKNNYNVAYEYWMTNHSNID